MPEALSRMTRPLGVRREPAHLFSVCGADYPELDVDLLEPRGCIIDVVLLSVAKRGPHIGRGIVDLDLVERREPRHLGEQSKGCAHHQKLKRGSALFGTATSKRLVGLDGELAHVPFEVDVIDDPRHRACGDSPLGRFFGAHLGTKAFDVAHLLLEVNASPPRTLFPAHGIKL